MAFSVIRSIKTRNYLIFLCLYLLPLLCSRFSNLEEMDIQDGENVAEPENLRKKLAVAVRSVQWSYAIFWASSTTEQGVLEWGEGYYNGDIKTRKTVQSKDCDAHRLGFQRSEQLRKLYLSLLEGDSEVGTKRPSGALSPEDLSNLEWYYLVCMSFTFKFGQSLPGRALATGQHIWLYDTQSADSKVFSRSLLAKSASIQTVICFQHMGGVIELGITDLVPEDLNLIQHIKTTLLEIVKPICSEDHSYATYGADCVDIGSKITENGHEIVDTIPFSRVYPAGEETKFDKDIQNDLHHNALEDISINSPDDCSNECCHHIEESVMLDNTTSPFQNWHLIDDDIGQSLQDSTTFHGYLSQNFDSQEEPKLSMYGGNIGTLHSETFQDWSGSKIIHDTHYRRTLSVILESSNHFITDQNTSVCGCGSSFVDWTRDLTVLDPTRHAPQKTLKTILFKVPLMHAYSTSRSLGEEGGKVYPLKPQACHLYTLHSPSAERTDNGMLCTSEEKTDSEQYQVLKSMLPSITKTDETSILMDTIEYVKELEARVDELESCIDFEGSSTMKDLDLLEHTSDNYERVEDEQKTSIVKWKAYETDPETDIQPLDVTVHIVEQEVLVRMRCPWREHLLLDIMEVVNNLTLDTHTVESSTLNGILSLFLKSKIQQGAFASEEMIKQALRRTIGICEEAN